MNDAQMLIAVAGVALVVAVPCIAFFVRQVREEAAARVDREHMGEMLNLISRRLSKIEERLDEYGNRMTRMEAKHNGGCKG